MNEFEVKSEDQNKCDVMSGERLFYNRVPKCGSTTLITLLRKLSKLNGFIHLNSKIYDKRMLDIKQQSFENCVKSKDPECAYNYNNSFVMSLVPYFCGQSDKCLQMGDKWALEVAKHNIEKSYQVIGVLEHMNITLNTVISGPREHITPHLFGGRVHLSLKRIASHLVVKGESDGGVALVH
ncbi:unnamed protein product [Oppiella nova]|uniref:Sulfotransferase n=1 Tax=Oppiella nova TaxID=334625 RepID=A0A7R9L9L9_9ACAR|nr:unnamed protein product [Oppiella nova]CAG2160962.1 unnamed protein product [Oppiella nova]